MGPEFYVSFGSNSNATQDEITIQVLFDLANFPAHFDYIRVEGTIGSLSDDALNLLNPLQSDSRIGSRIGNAIKFVTMEEVQPSSPAFLVILMAAMKKTKCLQVECTLSDTTAYACLATGLLAHGGIEELKLHGAADMEAYGAKVLAEALVCTTCQKQFQISNCRFWQFPRRVCMHRIAGSIEEESIATAFISFDIWSHGGRRR